MNTLDYFNNYKLDSALLSSKESARYVNSFVEKYPLEKILELSLDDYMISKAGFGNPNSFCRTLRYEMDIIGHMGNVWFDVFGVYLNNGVEIKLSKTFSNQFGDDVEGAFLHIKQQIAGLIKAGKAENLKAIEQCELNNAFKYKLLTVYCFDHYIPVSTRNTLDEYCSRVGIRFDPREEPIYRNVALRDFMREHPKMKNWNNSVMMGFCDWLWRSDKDINSEI